jgi:chaperonin GroEL
MLSHSKVKSVGKVMTSRGTRLDNLIQTTLKTCSDIVGSTLGPGGMSVVLERQESGLPPITTKDGVTVFKALGFQDASQQVLMEAAREASVRTAAEAGDGTTTATILSEALVSNISALTRERPTLSPQRITRRIQQIFKKEIEPFLKSAALSCDMTDNRERLYNVARISANGDADLAKAVLECYELVGDDGNVTITEAAGDSVYEVEKIDGFPIPMGYEESCGAFFPEFITDAATQQCLLKKPLWILNHGSMNDFNEVYLITQLVAREAGNGRCSPNIVVVATSFSETFRAQCAATFGLTGAVKVFPLLAPRTIQKTSQLDFLEDMAALTMATVWNPLTKPLALWEDLAQFGNRAGPESFEIGRFRASVIGRADEDEVINRAEIIDRQLASQVQSELDRQLLVERKAKLVNGIAKLIVRGASTTDVKERRDRAEDAVCAVRNAIRNGALPGGGVTWMALHSRLHGVAEDINTPALDHTIIGHVLLPSIKTPVLRLFTNAGYSVPDAEKMVTRIAETGIPWDLTEEQQASPNDLLDSYGAVYNSLRNAISVANLLGTCGGVVVFPRDSELERREAVDAMDYMRAANTNEANERG